MNRRNFLRSISLLTMGTMGAQALESCSKTPQTATVSKRFGLQIFGLGPELGEDIPGGFKRLKEMGYSTLELAGYRDGAVALFTDPIPLPEYQQMAQDSGLKVTCSHLRPGINVYNEETLPQLREFWKRSAEDHAKAGVDYVIQAAIPPVHNVEEAQAVADAYNQAAQIAKEAGIKWAFHNEPNEFGRVLPGGTENIYNMNGRYEEGTRIIYDILMEGTDPSLVQAELDCLSAVQAGCDPVAYLKKYPNRITLMHVKDNGDLGTSGMINYENIFKQFFANGQHDYFIEDEDFRSGKQFERIGGAAQYLLQSPFVK